LVLHLPEVEQVVLVPELFVAVEEQVFREPLRQVGPQLVFQLDSQMEFQFLHQLTVWKPIHWAL
jgi:hypothetical protein